MPALTLIPGNSNSSFGTVPGTTIAHKFLELTATGNVTISASLSASTTYYAIYNSRANDIGNADWETGNYTVEFNVTTALNRCNARVRLHRHSTDGTLVESSAFTATQSCQTTGIKTFTFTGLDLSTTNPKAVQDRLVVEIEIIVGTTAGTLAFDIGDTNAEVVTPIIGGHVLRPDPVPFDFNAVAPTMTRPHNLAVTPTPFDFNPVAPTRTSPLSLAASPTPFDFNVVAPTRTSPLSLAVSPTPFDFNVFPPTMTRPYTLPVTPTPFIFLPVAPTLDLPLSLAVSPTPFVFFPVAPSVSMAGAQTLMIAPTPIVFRAVAPTRTSPLSLLLSPTPFVFEPVAPTRAGALSLAISPTPFIFRVAAPTYQNRLLDATLTRATLLALHVLGEVRLVREWTSEARFARNLEIDTALWRKMVRSTTLRTE